MINLYKVIVGRTGCSDGGPADDRPVILPETQTVKTELLSLAIRMALYCQRVLGAGNKNTIYALRIRTSQI